MKPRKRVLCIVDDDPEEVRRFCEHMATRFVVGGGTSLDTALENLRSQGYPRPDLWVLDLYFPENGSSTPEQREQLADEREKALASQARFAALLAEFGQTIKGGFRHVDRLSPYGSRPPFVFFSRKASADDVVRALDKGALRVIKKPDPTADERSADLSADYDRAMARAANDVARDIEDAISRSSFWWKYGKVVIGFIIGLVSSAAAGQLNIVFAKWPILGVIAVVLITLVIGFLIGRRSVGA
jgi:CheY-like chemotaxis protein